MKNRPISKVQFVQDHHAKGDKDDIVGRLGEVDGHFRYYCYEELLVMEIVFQFGYWPLQMKTSRIENGKLYCASNVGSKVPETPEIRYP
jgi:hypothetical protein